METKANETHRVLRFSLWSDGRTTLGQPVTTTTYEELMDEFCHADQLGFHGVWASEHHGFDDGYLLAPFTENVARKPRSLMTLLGNFV